MENKDESIDQNNHVYNKENEHEFFMSMEVKFNKRVELNNN